MLRAANWPALVGQGLVDGLVLMEVQMEDQRVQMLTEHKMPFTLIGRTRDHAGLYCVDIDFDTSIELAIEHLVALGHRRIVYGAEGPHPARSGWVAMSGRRRRTAGWPSCTVSRRS